jgi:hypothetical protein
MVPSFYKIVLDPSVDKSWASSRANLIKNFAPVIEHM